MYLASGQAGYHHFWLTSEIYYLLFISELFRHAKSMQKHKEDILNKTNEQIIERIKRETNFNGTPAFETNRHQNIQVSMRVDDKVEPGKFVKDPLVFNGYKACYSTLKALRRDIFITGEFSEMSDDYTCEKCKKLLDLQFWLCCPYCEEPFPKR